jgi:Flp pilus assembly protein TadG
MRSLRTRNGRNRATGRRGEQGQALAEFALVLPVLMLVTLGIIKGGLLYNNYLQLTDAVRSGAREFAVERGQATPCMDAAAIVNNAAGGLNVSSISMTMSEYPDPAPPDTYTTQNPSNCPALTSGSAVTLKATYPCDLSIMGVVVIPNCTLSASATEQVE